MKLYSRLNVIIFLLFFLSIECYGQITVSGKIKDERGEALIGINVIVKDKLVGASTDLNGNFNFITTTSLPFKINISGVGFKSQDIEVTTNNQSLEITMVEDISMANEIVVSASRVEESNLQSPVSIEKMDIIDIQQTASNNFYDGLANLKGIDVVPSGMLIKMVNARGFGGPYQTRFVQRFDGMDMQSPSLSIPFGNIAGIHDIDVESVEIQPGAASALYGPNAFNGIMNMTSRSPFLYQGLTAQLKGGLNNLGHPSSNVDSSPYYEIALRYGKAFNNKFAFKVNFSYLRADDWVGDEQRFMEPNANGILTLSNKTGNNGNALNTYGDETPITDAMGQPVLVGGVPIYRTGYKESELTDYRVENLRAGITFYYRFTENLEVSYLFKYAEGNGVLSGGNRYSYNPQYFIHKLELKGSNFFLRAYNLRQKMADGSYDLNNSALALQAQNKDNATWIADYQTAFNTNGGNHDAARISADEGRLESGTVAFNTVFEQIQNNKPADGGTAFIETGDITHIEGQYDFTNLLNNVIGLTVGASYRRFQVDSEGTIFDDGEGKDPVSYFDVGAYVQANKSFFQNKLRLLGSLRYDKSEFFEGLVTPRASMVISPFENHNIRASYQTGFKNPIFQEQSIFFTAVPGALPIILAGGREGFLDNAHTGLDASLTNEIIVPFVEPEKVTSWEFGYKAMITSDLFFDISYNRSTYDNFIGLDLSQLVVYAPELLTGSADPNIPDAIYAFYINLSGDFRTQGIATGLNYTFGNGFEASANYTWSNLIDELPEGFVPSFNTPEHKINLGFGNRKVTDKLGFNVTWRWQSEFDYLAVLGGANIQGKIESFNVFDAQVTYKIMPWMTAKIGGSNIFNQYYRQALASGNIGGMYYLTLTFDKLGL